MPKLGVTAFGSTLASSALLVAMSAGASASDLSRYREFQFGADVGTVAKWAGMDSPDVKVIHRRPALIQDLSWRPRPLGWSAKAEAVQDVVFSFYDGALYRIVVDYDRDETEGLTAADMVEAFSADYGKPVPRSAPARLSAAERASESDQETVLARWQDAQYRFVLVRSAYGPGFRLTGVQMRLETAAATASKTAARLDDQEAPQRDAARIAGEVEAANARREKARLENKPKFRP